MKREDEWTAPDMEECLYNLIKFKSDECIKRTKSQGVGDEHRRIMGCLWPLCILQVPVSSLVSL